MIPSADQKKLNIIPDYDKSKEEIYVSFTRKILELYGNLDILQFCQFQDASHQLPSWVPDLSIPAKTRALYFGHVAGSRDRAIGGSISTSDRELHVTGVQAGALTCVEKAVPYQPEIPEILAMCRIWEPQNLLTLSYKGGGTLFDAYLKAITCGIVADDEIAGALVCPTLSEYRDGYTHLIKEQSVAYDFHGRFIHAIQFSLPGRSFGTTDKGHLGVFPGSSQVEDQICVVFGARFPLVLRPLKGYTNKFRFVSFCYVVGMMDGEAILGSLPKHWSLGQVNEYNDRLYVNDDGRTTTQDPRLGPLPSGWKRQFEDGQEINADGKSNGFWCQNEITGKAKWDDPRWTKEALLEQGVGMKDFVIV